MAGRSLLRLVAALGVAAVLGCHAREPQDMKADPGLRAALGRDGVVHVLVALEPPAGLGESGADTTRIALAIENVQDRVLAALDTADFRVRTRYRNVPAIAGTLRTERGLRLLAGHPDVVRIDFDRGGGGIR